MKLWMVMLAGCGGSVATQDAAIEDSAIIIDATFDARVSDAKSDGMNDSAIDAASIMCPTQNTTCPMPQAAYCIDDHLFWYCAGGTWAQFDCRQSSQLPPCGGSTNCGVERCHN